MVLPCQNKNKLVLVLRSESQSGKCAITDGYTHRLYRLKAQGLKIQGGSSKLWHVQSQLPVYDRFDNYSSKFYVLIIREINFFTHSDSALITVFQRISMNFNMIVGQAACRLLCWYTQCSLAASCTCWMVAIVNVWVRRKNLWLFVFEMHLIKAWKLHCRQELCVGLAALTYNKNIVASYEQYCSFVSVSIT